MNSIFEYTTFKTDVLDGLSTSSDKFSLKYNTKLSSQEDDDYVVILENDFCRVQITMLDYFPRILIGYYFYDKTSEDAKPISDKRLKEFLKYTNDDLSQWWEADNTNSIEASIKIQIKGINMLFLHIYNPVLNGYFY